MKALTKIILVSEKRDEWDEASTLQKKMENFSFLFLVVQQTKILEHDNAVSEMLKSNDADIQKAVSLPQNTIQA